MRRILIVLAGFAVVSFAAVSRASAQTSTSNLTVTATVAKNCTISTTPVAFGAYDPVTANAAAPLDGAGSVIVTCTKGATAWVGMGPGNNHDGTTRRMSGGSADHLTYELYTDSSHAKVWGITVDTGLSVPEAPDLTARDFPVYGQIPQAQTASPGSYTDSVVATVNF